MSQILLKVATLNLSEYCGNFIIKLKGQHPNLFRVIDRDLYLIEKIETPGGYSVIVSIEDPAGRFPPKTQTYTLSVNSCILT